MKGGRAWCAALGASALLLPACRSALLKPPRWTVEVSPLDYVQFLCSAEGAGEGGQMLKVELLGTGHLTSAEGRSRRVSDDFWDREDDPHWGEYRTDSVHVDASYVRACFQHLVDIGFFEDGGAGAERDGKQRSGILVVASINGRKKAAFTSDKRVAAAVRELLKQF